MRIELGNLLEAPEIVICHQVNCLGVMGAGLAKQRATKYPNTYKIYREECNTHSSEELLGTVLFTEEAEFDGTKRIIANIFGQNGISRRDPQTNLGALASGFFQIEKLVPKEYTIAIPYGIGCGLGGADWDIVLEIIKSIFKERELVIYQYT